MFRWLVAALTLSALLIAPHPVGACSLCGGLSQLTLRQEMNQAKMVLYGTLANPRASTDPARLGGTTELHILRVLKDDPIRGGRTVVELGRYLPVLDPRDPPKFLVFCEVVGGRLDPYRGKAVRSQAVLDYLLGAQALKGKSRTETLLYYFRFLSNKDATISEDAYLEFARSTDQEIGDVARRLDSAQLRRLIADKDTPPSRLGLYAFLLGACGGPKDAELLRSLIDRPTDRTTGVLDGLLSGYISLRPAEGWDLVVRILSDRKRPFNERFAISRTLRLYHSWKPAESQKQVLRALAVMVADGDVADLAIEDLRQWKLWDLTDTILAQYGKASHNSPIVKRTITRYALCCPLPQARRFVDELRRQDPATVRDVEEALSYEKQR
jgi:hypothetical protein